MSDALPTSVAEQWGKHTMADINSRMKAPEWSCLVPHPDDPSKLVCYVGVPCTHVGLSQNCHKCINRVRPCGDVTAKPKDNRLGNFKKHLERIHGTKRERERDQSEGNEATHSVSQSSVPAQGQLIQSTIPECAAKRAANYTGNPLLANAQQREKEAIAFAVNGISFAVCQSEEFRVAYSPSIILGRDMSAQTVVTCKQMLALKIAATKNLPVTLAFDSGTVWRRWFAVMVIVPGQVPSNVYPGVVFGCVQGASTSQQVVLALLPKLKCKAIIRKVAVIIAAKAIQIKQYTTQKIVSINGDFFFPFWWVECEFDFALFAENVSNCPKVQYPLRVPPSESSTPFCTPFAIFGRFLDFF